MPFYVVGITPVGLVSQVSQRFLLGDFHFNFYFKITPMRRAYIGLYNTMAGLALQWAR